MFYFRTGFKHIPCILGKEIDLYLLYWLVTSQGGWEKVRLAFCLGITKEEGKLSSLLGSPLVFETIL